MSSYYKRVIILHGYGGSSAIHWQTWLSKKCKAMKLITIYPKFPNKNKPDPIQWNKSLLKIIPKIDKNTAIICHSLGCVTALNYLQHHKGEKLGLLVLVAPTSLSRLIGTPLEFLKYFFIHSSYKLVKRKLHRCVIFTSNNDEWVNLKEARTLGVELDSEFHLIKNGGHLSVRSGFHTFPKILELLQYPN